MDFKNNQLFEKGIIIVKFNRQFSSDLKLLFSSNSEDTSVLNQGFIYNILQSVRLLPNATNFVAYHVQDKIPIGFITLEENTKTLFSIKNLLVNPQYRRIGVGSALLDNVIALAKQKRALKLNLNVYTSNTSIIEQYKNLGFREIGHTLLAQSFLPGFSKSKVLKRFIFGKRSEIGQTGEKKPLFVEQKNSSIMRQNIFDIYKQCMSKEWINFFEVDSNNLRCGSHHVWEPPFFKNVLISNSDNSFALIFNQPFPLKDSIELYKNPDVPMLPLLEDLLVTLSNRGTGFTQLWLFGLTNDIPIEWFKEKKMMIFDFLSMGKTFGM